MSPADIVRLVADGEISRGRALELLRPHLATPMIDAVCKTMLVWRRGFPEKSGMYLVDLGNREYCVTPYTVPGTEGVDTWGDPRRAGWSCLTGSAATVRAWAAIPAAEAPQMQRSLNKT